jgi:RimJ/RimL family protein N-acetyltransferase
MQDRGCYTVEKAAEVHNARSRAVMERLEMRHVGRILRPGFVA